LKHETIKSQKIDQLRDLNRDISTSAFFYENKINEIQVQLLGLSEEKNFLMGQIELLLAQKAQEDVTENLLKVRSQAG
jgi:hypothetical protein